VVNTNKDVQCEFRIVDTDCGITTSREKEQGLELFARSSRSLARAVYYWMTMVGSFQNFPSERVTQSQFLVHLKSIPWFIRVGPRRICISLVETLIKRLTVFEWEFDKLTLSFNTMVEPA
jgi:hypothetical protein